MVVVGKSTLGMLQTFSRGAEGGSMYPWSSRRWRRHFLGVGWRREVPRTRGEALASMPNKELDRCVPKYIQYGVLVGILTASQATC